MKKPNLSKASIWNMSMGFLGIQMGFALQNGNASRILLNFGADVEELGWFWLVAPMTGLIVQPIVGHYSDHTWTRLGRRRPYFLVGTLVASIGLLLLPNAELFINLLPALWVGAVFLIIMDASFNVSMEPFRALVADRLNSEQRTQGYSIQTVLIGIGAVIGSWLPYALKNWFGIANTASGSVPSHVVWSFSIGAIILLGSIVWTVVNTSEYTPEEVASFDGTKLESKGKPSFLDIFRDFATMPNTMKQLGLVQFFSWFGLFLMWVYSTPAIAQHIYNLPIDDSSSITFNEAGDWVGILFGIYNAVSALYAFALPKIAVTLGRKNTHTISLLLGAASLISIYFVTNPLMLLLPMIGIGIAWASILAMPYAILGGAIPDKKMGIYMGIFNFFITLPQIASAVLSGKLLSGLFENHAIYLIILAGACFLIAAVAVRLVDDKDALVPA